MKTLTKVTLSNFNPDVILSMPAETQEVRLGIIIGRATGVVRRTRPDNPDEPFEGLKGNFEIYFDKQPMEKEAKEPLSSGICFVPEAFQEPIIDLLTEEVDSVTGEVTKPAEDAVKIAWEVFAIRADNPRKRSWQIRVIYDPEAERPRDMLSELRDRAQKLLPNIQTQQIEGPKSKAKA